MKILAINDLFEEKHIELIKKGAAEAGAQVHFYTSDKEIPQSDFDADIIYGFAPEIVKVNKKHKWLCVSWAFVVSLMAPGYFANEDCILTNSAGSYGVSIAEHMIATSLVLLRRMNEFFDETRAGFWGKPRSQKSLKDCRITVLGTGDIGCTFAQRVRSFEPASLTGVCRSGVCREQSFDRILRIDHLDEILPETDLLIMCLPETADTKGILSKERISLLPDGAYVVNVGRGSAIDEEALADNLISGKLAGAALDVFCKEPLPKESCLWEINNLIITPHVAGNLTLDYTLDKNVEMFCEDLARYAEGMPLWHVIDKNRGY